MADLKRALVPSTNATGLGSSAAAIYAGIVMVWNATHHHAVIDPQVIVAAAGAAGFLYARFKVTPVADPKDGNGQPLIAAVPVSVAPLTPYDVATGWPGKTLMPPAPAAPEPPAEPPPAGSSSP